MKYVLTTLKMLSNKNGMEIQIWNGIRLKCALLELKDIHLEKNTWKLQNAR